MTAEDNKNKILAGTEAVNNRDIQGFIRLLEPGFKLFLIVKPEQLLPEGRVSGPEGFATYLHMLYTAFSNVVFQQQNVQAQGNMVHQEFLILGKHTGPLMLPNGLQIPPTGLKIQLPIEVFHSFNTQGGFISSTGYVNLLDIMKQFKNRSSWLPQQK
jgi:predicted ester cyclase